MATPTDGETATLLRSIRRWLLVLVALSGVVLVALVAGFRALPALFGGSPSATTNGSSPAE